MKIHAVASMPHYEEHILAVWKHLPDSQRGRLFLGRASVAKEIDPRDLVLVASHSDIERARGNPVIYIEHGAGQKYITDRGADYYHGAKHPENVVAYICPRQEVADAWGRPAIAVGSPVCDSFELFTNNENPVIAITFHWNAERVCPEAGTALDHYVTHLGRLVRQIRAQNCEVIGHRHPRNHRLSAVWKNLHVRTADVGEVRRTADILIADNTSLMYEMAHLNRMVVSLNAPWYRREVNHGLRFWDAVPGLEIDDPFTLLKIDWRALATPGDCPLAEVKRTEASMAAYDLMLSNGHAGVKAAAFVTLTAAKL